MQKDNILNKKILVEKATLGAGCFWCVEAIYECIDGILETSVGYAGGTIKNPTYKQVCSGLTGYIEVAQVKYDPRIIDFYSLLNVFWRIHDPTTMDRQGSDSGTQYRSAIFFHDEKQKEIAVRSMRKLSKSNLYKNGIRTEIRPIDKFYLAEDYHQGYFKLNKNAPYCKAIIKPKLEKFLNNSIYTD